VIFPTNLYLLSALGAGLTTLLTLPLWRAWCRRIGLMDDPGDRKIHQQPIPLAGGLAILTGILLPVLAALVAVKLGLLEHETTAKLGYGFGRRSGQLSAILGGAAGMTFLGWLDDRHELRPRLKFAGQLVIATLVAAAGVRITLFVPSPLFSYAITILWILAVTNALNFLDNMNGLCAGLGIIASLLVGLAAARHSQYLVAAISFLAGGATLGFLPWNFPRASAFLGDAGSHLIGYLLAVLSILPHFYSAKHPNEWAVLSPLLILAVPLTDLVWVVLLRWRSGKPFYIGDNNHVSHRLVGRGLSQTRTVLILWTIAALAGGVTLFL
jgi:UDP-GlcNAc:undecaprenyl-phosphate/decaprenyl-phosphate GlcNAc-1-phosphate transferase